jgi:hypothetical protein
MSKLTTVAVAAVAYALGARAGRERYEQIVSNAQRFWRDPRVQQKKHQAADAVKDRAPQVKDQVTDAVKQTVDKVRSRNDASQDAPEEPSAGVHSAAATPTSPANGAGR